MTKNKSNCIFCNSTSYGSGCAYSPHKKHVHTSDGTKCIYCGSVSTGHGCPHNPFSKIHIKGVEYNSMIKESMGSSLLLSLLYERLFMPIEKMGAFKRGLIDKKGNIIKERNTQLEKSILTESDYYFLKLRKIIGEEKLNVLKQNILLENATNSINKNHDKEAICKIRASRLVNDIRNFFIESNEEGIARERLEEIVLDSFLIEK